VTTTSSGRNEIFDAEIFVVRDDLGAPLVGEGVADVFELFADHVEQRAGRARMSERSLICTKKFLELGDDLILFEARSID